MLSAGVAQLVRASVFQTEGLGFDPLLPLPGWTEGLLRQEKIGRERAICRIGL